MIPITAIASSVAWARKTSSSSQFLRRNNFSFIGWVKDVSRTGRLLPGNPIQESFALVLDQDDVLADADRNKNQHHHHHHHHQPKALFPNFTHFYPHHLQNAFVQASRLTQSRLNRFQQKLSTNLKYYYYPEQKQQQQLLLSFEAIVGERHKIPALIEYLVSLQNLYYSLVGSAEWKRACSQIPLEANWESDALRMALEHLYQAMPTTTYTSASDTASADAYDGGDGDENPDDRRYIVYKLLLLYRLHSITALDSVEMAKLRYRISELERIFRDPSRRTNGSRNATSETTTNTNDMLLLDDMAEYFVLKQDLARSRGLDTFADWILKDRMVDRFKLLSLLKKVLNQADATLVTMESSLSSSSSSSSAKPTDVIVSPTLPHHNQKVGEPKQHHISEREGTKSADFKSNIEQPDVPLIPPAALSFELESVLETLFRVVESLFGVVIDEEEHVHAWHPDVRLFHVYEESCNNEEVEKEEKEEEKGKYLGSFYLDPLARSGKDETVTSMVLFMGSRTVPILATHAATLLRGEGNDATTTSTTTTTTTTTTLSLPYVAALFKSMGGAMQSIFAGPMVVGFYNRHVHLQDIEPLWKNFFEHWLMDDGVQYSLAQTLLVNGKRPESQDDGKFSNNNNNKRFQSKLIRDSVRYMKALTLSELSRLSAVEVELFSTVVNDINLRLHDDDDEGTSPGLRLKEYLERKSVSPEAVVYLLQQNAEGYLMSHYRTVLSDIMAARLFLTFQSSITEAKWSSSGDDGGNERQFGDGDDDDDDDKNELLTKRLEICQKPLGDEFRRRFARPRPPWCVQKDLEQVCGSQEASLSPAPLQHIYGLKPL